MVYDEEYLFIKGSTMKKTYLIASAIGVLMIGGATAYQFGVKPTAQNQVEVMLADLKSEIETRGDGSEFHYGDVKIEGLSAIIPNMRYVDGEQGLVVDIGEMVVSATAGNIRSATISNVNASMNKDDALVEYSIKTSLIENLSHPVEMTDALGVSDVTYDSIEMNGITANIQIEDFPIIVMNADTLSSKNKDTTSIATTALIGGLFDIAEYKTKIEIADLNASNTQFPAEMGFFEVSDMKEFFDVYRKIYSEASNLEANIHFNDFQIASITSKSKNNTKSESGALLTSDASFSYVSKASRPQLIALMKSMDELSPEDGFDEDAVNAFFDELGHNEYGLDVNSTFSLASGGDVSFNMVYDLLNFGSLNIDAQLADFDSEILNNLVIEMNKNPDNPNIDPQTALAIGALKGAKISYDDEGLADLLFRLNPQVKPEQLAFVAPLMLSSMLSTEPNHLKPASDAVSGFLTGKNAFEIDAAPTSSVPFQSIADTFFKEESIGDLLNITVSGS